MIEKEQKSLSRAPIVVVMGHVDHGKTTLLDYIRNTNIAQKEKGGITQHIGAYEISYNDKKITFIDTPGHEAFYRMRMRGVHIADIAILVVAADEGVEPQTKEAIKHILESNTDMIVAINKIDKPGADPQKVKQQLASHNVLVEEWGGKIPAVEISAKTGQGVNDLLDLILLLAELKELKANPDLPAEGMIIEAAVDRRRGIVATLIIQNGTLKKGDFIIAGSAIAKVKLIENFEGRPVEYLLPSSPGRILGWETLPPVGEYFHVGDEKDIRSVSEEITKLKQTTPVSKGDINLIIKTDVVGSQEALKQAISQLPNEVEISIVSSSVGDITESDVKLAYATGAIIIAFRSKILPEAKNFVKNYPVRIIIGDIIYELIDLIKEEVERIKEEKILEKIKARLEVLAIFASEDSRQIIGGKVIDGTLKKGMMVDIIRKGEKIGRAKIINLQKSKQNVEEVETGFECGILLDSGISVLKGDILEEIKYEKS